MNTKKILNLILDKLPFSQYGLAKKLHISYTTLTRYLSGINEAGFEEVFVWLNKLGLFIVDNQIFLKNVQLMPLEKLTKKFATTSFMSLEDSNYWKKEGALIEQKEGHAIAWLHKKW